MQKNELFWDIDTTKIEKLFSLSEHEIFMESVKRNHFWDDDMAVEHLIRHKLPRMQQSFFPIPEITGTSKHKPTMREWFYWEFQTKLPGVHGEEYLSPMFFGEIPGQNGYLLYSPEYASFVIHPYKNKLFVQYSMFNAMDLMNEWLKRSTLLESNSVDMDEYEELWNDNAHEALILKAKAYIEYMDDTLKLTQSIKKHRDINMFSLKNYNNPKEMKRKYGIRIF